MISLIVCSVRPHLLEKLKVNVAQTIGCVYELLVTDNRVNRRGLSEVYNSAASKAKYKILCFIHEDISFHTYYWGKALVDALAEPAVGLVGVSGTVYKSSFPAIWSACDQSLYRTHTIQHFRKSKKPIYCKIKFSNEKLSEVAVLDGVFLATRRDVFDEFYFDETQFKGFHAYDLDFSLQVGSKYKVVVSYDILLEHFSEGSLSKEWFQDYMLLHKKWEKTLPKQVNFLAPDLKKKSDYIACQSVLHQVIKSDLGKWNALYYFSILITRFLYFNKIRFSKSVFKYLLTSSNENSDSRF